MKECTNSLQMKQRQISLLRVKQESVDNKQFVSLPINSLNCDKNQNQNQKYSQKQAYAQKNYFQQQTVPLKLPINEKMMNLQKKGNKLIQKVLAIQQQIQKYSQIQQKQLRTFGSGSPSSPLLKTKSALDQNKQLQQMNAAQNQHQINLRRMNVLGKNKVKMIQNLQTRIQNLQEKIIDEPNQNCSEIEQVKKQIDNKFDYYYKHKNDILKQSKSEKFSFKSLKYLTKQSKYDKSKIYEQNIQTIQEINMNQQDPEAQIKNLKQQFSSYQQRTNKQLQNYKERLNQNTIQKQILKKEVQKIRYEHLEQKLFNRNKSSCKQKLPNSQNTSNWLIGLRQFAGSKQHVGFKNIAGQKQKLEQKGKQNTNKSCQKSLNIAPKLPSNDYPTNEQQHQFQDLQQFKDELNLKYIEQNYQIQQLNERIKQLQQTVEDQRDKHDKNYLVYLRELQELNFLLDEKQRLIADISETNQNKDQQIQGLKNQINDMNNYILRCKQQNQAQNEQLQQYKNIIEEFVDQIKILRNQISQKSVLNQQFNWQLQESIKRNRVYESQIKKVRQQSQNLRVRGEQLQKAEKLRRMAQQCTVLFNKAPKDGLTDQGSPIVPATIIQKEILNHPQQQGLEKCYQSQLANLKTQYQLNIGLLNMNIQQLQQALGSVNSSLNQKVDQEVNQAIRTFLRYRKHANCIQSQTFKLIVHAMRPVNANIVKKQSSNLKANENIVKKVLPNLKAIEKQVQNDKGKQVMKGAVRPETKNFRISLRKLIDTVYSGKFIRSSEQQFCLKIALCVKLINFSILILNQQHNTENGSSKSIKQTSTKLPSLNLQNIFLIQNIDDQEQGDVFPDLNVEQKVRQMQRNIERHQLVFQRDEEDRVQQKRDKSLVYLSPQVLLSMNQSQHSYCWTLGLMIDEILNSRPFYTKIQQIINRRNSYKFENINGYPGPSVTSLQNVLQKMLRKSLKQRPTLQQAQRQFSRILAFFN